MSGEVAPTTDDIGETIPLANSDPKAERERDGTFNSKHTFPYLRNKRFHEQSERLKEEHTIRLRAAKWVFGFVLGWLVFVGFVILLAGFGCLAQLSEKVLIALLATTTATVIGLLAAVVRYLFPPNPEIFGQDTLPTARGNNPGKKAKKSRL